MQPSDAEAPILRFGAFSLDLLGRTLRHGKSTVALSPKEFDLLAAFVRMYGRVVSKPELLDHAWSGTMSDAAIFQAVYRLRRTLAQYDRHEYLVTVPGRGYQFVARVVEEDAAGRYDVSDTAFAVYSRAMFQFHQGTKQSLLSAISLFERATRIDPTFALAHVGLANSHLCMGLALFADQASCQDRSLQACREALKLDSRCADAYAILSQIHAFFGADIGSAQSAIQKALSLDPNSWRVRMAAFWVFLTGNHLERALRYVSEALASDPSSNHFTTLLGVGLYYQRRYDEAHARLTDAHLFKPGDAIALFYDACTLCCIGDYGGAEQRLTVRDALERDPRVDALRVYVAAKRGESEKATRIVEGLLSQPTQHHVALALALSAVGRLDDAATHARVAITSREIGCYLIGLDPLFEPLRYYGSVRNG